MKPIHIRQRWDDKMPRYLIFVDGRRHIDPAHYDSEFYPKEMPYQLRKVIPQPVMTSEMQAH